jgi:hypothetical protein
MELGFAAQARDLLARQLLSEHEMHVAEHRHAIRPSRYAGASV